MKSSTATVSEASDTTFHSEPRLLVSPKRYFLSMAVNDIVRVLENPSFTAGSLQEIIVLNADIFVDGVVEPHFVGVRGISLK